MGTLQLFSLTDERRRRHSGAREGRAKSRPRHPRTPLYLDLERSRSQQQHGAGAMS